MKLNFEQFRDSDAMTREEGELMYALVRATKPRFAVETGTHRGLSSCYIGAAMQENHKGHLWTCDPRDWGAKENIKSVGMEDRITYFESKGIELGIESGQKIDFLFIDGYHGKKDVIEEIDYFFPHLSERAIVVFHDCDPIPSCGVNQAIEARGLKTTLLWTQNRMRIYDHSKL